MLAVILHVRLEALARRAALLALAAVLASGSALLPISPASASNPTCAGFGASSVPAPGDYLCGVPAGVSEIAVTLTGGGGGGGGAVFADGGGGAVVNWRLPVSGGETLSVSIGTGGTKTMYRFPSELEYFGGGGGGPSIISRGATKLMIAAGGGGGGASAGAAGGSGASGNTADGGPGSDPGGGGGASQSAGGAGGAIGMPGSVAGDAGTSIYPGGGANGFYLDTFAPWTATYSISGAGPAGGGGGFGLFGGGGGAIVQTTSSRIDGGGGGAGSSLAGTGATFSPAANGGVGGTPPASGGHGSIVFGSPPVITTVFPTSGPAVGGTTVTISGAGFTGATGVRFGSVAAASFTVDSDSTVTATTPSGYGVVDVSVIGLGGTTFQAEAFAFPLPPTAPAGGGESIASDPPFPPAQSVTALPSESPASPSRLDPMAPGSNPNLPAGGLPAGSSVLLVNGQPAPLSAVANAPRGSVALVFIGPGLTLRLEGRGDQGNALGLTSRQALVLQSDASGNRVAMTLTRDGVKGLSARAGALQRSPRLVEATRPRTTPLVRINGKGFAPQTLVKAYLLPVGFLGEVETDSSGAFEGSVLVPPGIIPGTYTLQLNAFAPDFSVRSLSTGVVVKSTSTPTVVARGTVYFSAVSPRLTRSAKASLRKLADQARAGRETLRSVLVGFVQPSGSTANDAALSMARAQVVADHLRSLGVTGAYVVRGEGRPATTGAVARRVEVSITYLP